MSILDEHIAKVNVQNVNQLHESVILLIGSPSCVYTRHKGVIQLALSCSSVLQIATSEGFKASRLEYKQEELLQRNTIPRLVISIPSLKGFSSEVKTCKKSKMFDPESIIANIVQKVNFLC